MPKPLFPAANAAKLKYELRFSATEKGLQEMKTVVVDVNDTGDENTNKADAIVTATLVLDDQGIKHWAFKSCAKVTS